MSGAAYDVTHWESFAVAVVGAAAALAGLLVVAASINIGQIITLPSVVSRLAATLNLFTGTLITGVLMLVPDQSRVALGLELVVLGVLLTALMVRLRGTEVPADADYRTRAVLSAVGTVGSAGLFVVAGVLLALGVGGGLYWTVPAVLSAFGLGLVNSWVALIEILR